MVWPAHPRNIEHLKYPLQKDLVVKLEVVMYQIYEFCLLHLIQDLTMLPVMQEESQDIFQIEMSFVF